MQVEENGDRTPIWSDRDLSDEDIRQILIEKVRAFWIEGVLKPSLRDRPYIPLTIAPYPDSADPVSENLEATLEPTAGKTLLILGDRGGGKTTTLLEIARISLDLAEQQSDRPVPAILPLSAWDGTQETIADWLVEELHRQYQIAPYIGEAWMLDESDRFPLMLLLDGLDEVSEPCRLGFLDALDCFMADRCQVAIALTCAIADYETLSQKPQFHQTIALRSLSCEQIDRYLADPELAPISEVLQDNPSLAAIAKTPLMLSLLPREIADPSDGLTEMLMEMYINQRFERFSDAQYSRENVRFWLSWLACSLCDRSQTLFFIEELHRDWLPGWQQQVYSLGIWAIGGVMTGPIIGLSSGLLGGLVMGWLRGPVGILAFRWLRGPIALVWLRVWVSRAVAPLLRLLRPLLLASVKALPRSLSGIVAISLRRKLARSLLRFPYQYISQTMFRKVTPKLIRRSLRRGVLRLGDGISREVVPNQRIWEAAKNTQFVAIIAALTTGAIAHLLDLSFFQGAIAGVLLGIFAAGGLCLQHIWVRFLLTFSGRIPWNYAAFLESAVESGFLYKIGGGYLFIHRSVQEHFAQFNSDRIQ